MSVSSTVSPEELRMWNKSWRQGVSQPRSAPHEDSETHDPGNETGRGDKSEGEGELVYAEKTPERRRYGRGAATFKPTMHRAHAKRLSHTHAPAGRRSEWARAK